MSHRIQNVKMMDSMNIQAVFLTGEIIQYNLQNLFQSLPQFQKLLSDPVLSSKLKVDQGGYGIS